MRLSIISLLFFTLLSSGTEDLKIELDQKLESLMPKVIEWRHDIHQYPELANREFRTSKKVADHLESLGLEVETGIAYTCLLYTSPSPRDRQKSRMPSSA